MKTTFADVVFTKSTDKATGVLLQYVGAGKHLRTARLALECGGRAMLTVDLTDVRVSKASTNWQSGMPKEQVSLAYTKVCLTTPGAVQTCTNRP